MQREGERKCMKHADREAFYCDECLESLRSQLKAPTYIYLVYGTSGQWEDFRVWIVRGFATKAGAENYAELCKNEGSKLEQKRDTLMNDPNIQDDDTKWNKAHDKWAKMKNKFDKEWEPLDFEADYFIERMYFVFDKGVIDER